MALSPDRDVPQDTRRATTADHPAITADSPAAPTRGLLPLLLTGNTAMYALYIGVGSVLLPLQIEHLDPAAKVANLGLVSGVAAVLATLFNPLAGALSDRSGRRNPWILGGGLAAVATMALLGSVDSVLLVCVAWCLGQAAMNFYQAAITSVVPDRVPAARRGTASAAVGLGLPLGSTLGVLLASAFADHLRTGYLVLGLLVALAAALFSGLARERRMPARTAVPLRDQAAAFLGVLRVRDFRWAFIGRALLVLGYFAVVGYQLYILQDHIDLPAGLRPEDAIAILTPVSAVAMAVSTVAGGVLSDRLDRRKPFVAASAALSAAALLIPVLSPTWPGMIVFSAVNGLAFGCFMAVDTALVTMVLPSAEDAARDLGVLNVANAGPQIVAPFVASAVVGLGGYTPLFSLGAVLAVAGALAVRPIRGVR
ncbi:MFS transporter [Kitasatospora sp. NPDC089913]|uniref:MFS transporter n=1 Tax=Streptomycetaceae TaxID=2062 RepID=UPI00087A472C|nr:MFS transporter [Streptomyces sp. TLI_053]SDT82624.1 Predicted arabinose efflux permease, MFS family [Streptomyces sp. TLI_053]